MTIALGMLAERSVIIAADAQESDGYFKDWALKIRDAMTQKKVQSSIAVTGAGPGVYLDAVTDEIFDLFHAKEESSVDAPEFQLKQKVSEFYREHVSTLPVQTDRDFRLIIGAQVEGTEALWTTDATALKRVTMLDAVGSGSPFAKMALSARTFVPQPESAILFAIFAVASAKKYDQILRERYDGRLPPRQSRVPRPVVSNRKGRRPV